MIHWGALAALAHQLGVTAFDQAIDGVLNRSELVRQDSSVYPSVALELAQLDLAHDALTVAHSELKAHGLAEAASGRLSLGELDARLHRAAALRDVAVHTGMGEGDEIRGNFREGPNHTHLAFATPRITPSANPV